jgi:hypothetical protein
VIFRLGLSNRLLKLRPREQLQQLTEYATKPLLHFGPPLVILGNMILPEEAYFSKPNLDKSGLLFTPISAKGASDKLSTSDRS